MFAKTGHSFQGDVDELGEGGEARIADTAEWSVEEDKEESSLSLVLLSDCANGQELAILEFKIGSDDPLDLVDVEHVSSEPSRSSLDGETVPLVANGQPPDGVPIFDDWYDLMMIAVARVLY